MLSPPDSLAVRGALAFCRRLCDKLGKNSFRSASDACCFCHASFPWANSRQEKRTHQTTNTCGAGGLAHQHTCLTQARAPPLSLSLCLMTSCTYWLRRPRRHQCPATEVHGWSRETKPKPTSETPSIVKLLLPPSKARTSEGVLNEARCRSRIRRAVRVHFRIDGDGLRDTCNISRAPFTSDRPEILSVFLPACIRLFRASRRLSRDRPLVRLHDLAQAHPTS